MYLWVLFSVQLCLVISVIWHGRRFKMPGGAGTKFVFEGEDYFYAEEKNKLGQVPKVVISFKVPARVSFVLRPEGWFDSLGKGLQLAREHLVGDVTFDNTFYVEDDDGAVAQLLRSNYALREQLLDGLAKVAAAGARVSAVDCGSGYLQLHLRTWRVSNLESLRGDSAEAFVPLVKALRELRPAPGEAAERRKLYAKSRQMGLGLFLAGAIGALGVMLLATVPLVDPWSLFNLSAFAGVLPFVLFLFWVGPRSSPSTRHRRALEWLLLTAPGCVLLTFVLLRGYNIHLDSSPPETVVVKDASVYTSKSRRGPRRYGVTFESDHRLFDGWSRFEIPGSTYETQRKRWGGDKAPEATVLLHEGALGFRWLELQP
ncbi:MAG: hypothetical protein WC538_11430 [Thermoanaerobaculia bacterium]|jgi:hypothetical protein